jgi:hypothetical protein
MPDHISSNRSLRCENPNDEPYSDDVGLVSRPDAPNRSQPDPAATSPQAEPPATGSSAVPRLVSSVSPGCRREVEGAGTGGRRSTQQGGRAREACPDSHPAAISRRAHGHRVRAGEAPQCRHDPSSRGTAPHLPRREDHPSPVTAILVPLLGANVHQRKYRPQARTSGAPPQVHSSPRNPTTAIARRLIVPACAAGPWPGNCSATTLLSKQPFFSRCAGAQRALYTAISLGFERRLVA